MLKQALSDEH